MEENICYNEYIEVSKNMIGVKNPMIGKKKPETAPEKVVNQYTKKHPKIWLDCMNEIKESHNKGHDWDRTRCAMPMELAVFATMDNKKALKQYAKDDEAPDQVLVAYNWRRDKEIIIMNKEQAEEAKEVSLDDIMTSFVLSLAQPSAYVDMSECDNDIDGFFYCIDHDRKSPETEEREYRFNILLVKNGIMNKAAYFPVDDETNIHDGISLFFNPPTEGGEEGDDDGWIEVVTDEDKEAAVDADYFEDIYKVITYIYNNSDKLAVINPEETESRIDRTDEEEDKELVPQPAVRIWSIGELVSEEITENTE